MNTVIDKCLNTNEIEQLAENYATEYSMPPHFTVGSDIDYDQFLEMATELKPELKEMFMSVANYILQEHNIIKKRT